MNARLAIRVNPANPNHHLWLNNGTWFVHYTLHPDPFRKERIRHSLGTHDLTLARQRRDSVLLDSADFVLRSARPEPFGQVADWLPRVADMSVTKVQGRP